jgi:predicted RNA-binding protein with RPS1 domain
MAASTPGASLSVGQVVEGTVTGITRFGAFVTLPNGQTGLVHISELILVCQPYIQNSTKLKRV